jgi:Fe-S-cluster-containing dehydrogenase component
VFVSIACLFCEDPSCVRSCPRRALRTSYETGVILVDEDKCNGCGWCIAACEFGALTLHRKKKVVVVCDLCEMKPKCVDFCPKEALSLMTTEEIAQKMRRKAVKGLLLE